MLINSFGPVCSKTGVSDMICVHVDKLSLFRNSVLGDIKVKLDACKEVSA